MSEMEELALRCEQACGPDRELDAEIMRLVGWGKDWMRVSPEAMHVWALYYTRSLDAAMTLAPEGCSFDLSKDHGAQGGQWLCIIGPDDCYHQIAQSHAATPALALCAAALRAKSRSNL